MKSTIVKIKSHRHISHDVIEIITEKPSDYSFEPGQATDVAIHQENWKDEKRPFTFTSLPDDDHLQFIIKIYPSHDGVTEQLSKLSAGDELTVGEVYGAIRYQGKGIFLAGGAGITPFISILKELDKKKQLDGHSLIFANKTEKDIFFKEKLETFLGPNYLNILSEEKKDKYSFGHIDKDFLKSMTIDLSQNFYLCGPPGMMEEVTNHLNELGVDEEKIVIEDFDE